jgi:hypothetical protein
MIGTLHDCRWGGISLQLWSTAWQLGPDVMAARYSLVPRRTHDRERNPHGSFPPEPTLMGCLYWLALAGAGWVCWSQILLETHCGVRDYLRWSAHALRVLQAARPADLNLSCWVPNPFGHAGS